MVVWGRWWDGAGMRIGRSSVCRPNIKRWYHHLPPLLLVLLEKGLEVVRHDGSPGLFIDG